jgi:putative flippase GtrA
VIESAKYSISAVRRAHALEFARFLIVGLINTGVGYGVYLALLQWAGYELAYAAAYVVGIVSAYLLNSLFVFRSPMRLGTALRYPFVYLAQYLFGSLLLYAMVGWFAVDRRWAALFALILSVPISFLLNRIALARRPRP